jgi:DNA uptake protein ComE-like DNA-binding protein
MRRLLSVVSLIGATACADRSQSADSTASDTAAPAGQTAAAVASVGTGLLDPNSATREQLAAVVQDTGAVTVLLAGRPYADMLAVDRALAGKMNAEQRKALYARVFKPIDLNTAKAEEILLIPGVGARMRHEFEEYRPYKDMAQFRREIGKYVDNTELARLERYVTIK